MRGRQMRSAWATSGLMMLGVMAGLPVQAQDTGLKVDALRLEVGGFTDEPGASGSTLVHGALSLRGDAGDWSYALGASTACVWTTPRTTCAGNGKTCA